jgi:hypothetical protein
MARKASYPRVSKDSRRAVQKRLDEELGRYFTGARSALMTAIFALEGKGVVDGYIATNLRMHVLNPLASIEAAATGRTYE